MSSLYRPDDPLEMQRSQAMHRDLMQAARHYLQEDATHRFADRTAHLKAIFLLMACIMAYVYLIFSSQALHVGIALIVTHIFGMALCINVFHDAAHGVIFRSKRANAWAARACGMILGIDADCWRTRHVLFHHATPNVEHLDLDISENGVFRQTPYQQWKPHMRWQHLFWPVIAAISLPYVAWVLDWQDKTNKNAVARFKILQGQQGWAIFFGTKLMHLVLMLGVPILIALHHGFPIWQMFIAYVLGQLIASMGVVILVLGTHWVEPDFYMPRQDGSINASWYSLCFTTACDCKTTPAWFGYWLGGLNMHLTHHLFPGWHHRHYTVLAELLKQYAIKHQYHYRCVTYSELWKAQQTFLKKMGKPK
ncbi:MULTISPECIES: fatty acid desaturase family protein [unclassified Acinetobacter]|uniref:fatty acid desaturase family protein n=1 Tax=unclassified Acinetobacter TaxID=196816 RepID=UPI0035B86D76